jgi:hypothetical protein
MAVDPIDDGPFSSFLARLRGDRVADPVVSSSGHVNWVTRKIVLAHRSQSHRLPDARLIFVDGRLSSGGRQDRQIRHSFATFESGMSARLDGVI